MFKLRNSTIICTKWAHFKFDVCYRFQNTVVGMGACLPWCSISSSFQNSLKTSGHRGYEFLHQFSTRTLLLPSLAVVIAAVCGFALSCWNTQGLPWYRRHLEGSICCSKTFIYLAAFIVPSKICKLPITYALMHHHTIRDVGFWTER